jgi:hypothetical protein
VLCKTGQKICAFCPFYRARGKHSEGNKARLFLFSPWCYGIFILVVNVSEWDEAICDDTHFYFKYFTFEPKIHLSMIFA